MPVRLCMDCRTKPATYRSRCRACAAARERDTHPNRRIYNTKRWRILRRRVLSMYPLCQWPGERCDRIATDVDHKVAIQDGGDIWALANLQSLCAHHHSAKTSKEMQFR